jgi:hypothetical protein
MNCSSGLLNMSLSLMVLYRYWPVKHVTVTVTGCNVDTGLSNMSLSLMVLYRYWLVKHVIVTDGAL